MARDARLLALGLVLALSAVVLVVTSWPERDDITRLQAEENGKNDVEAAPPQNRVSSEGRRVARHFAEAYFSTSRTSAAARRKRLEPYSSDALAEEMRINSGALAMRKSSARSPSEAEVIALQAQDGTAGNALVAIVERSTRSGGRTTNELVTVTLELVQEDGEWLVADVLVP